MAKKTKTRIKLPEVKLTSMPRTPRNPKGWNRTEVSITSRGHPALADFEPQFPAGEPPPMFRGSQPEWSVMWALGKLGYEEGFDYHFQARLPSAGAGYYATVDFLIPALDIGFEVQGLYWHYQQGRERVEHDIERHNLFLRDGIKVVFIDEDHANTRPIYIVQEGLMGNDHSRMVGRI